MIGFTLTSVSRGVFCRSHSCLGGGVGVRLSFRYRGRDRVRVRDRDRDGVSVRVRFHFDECVEGGLLSRGVSVRGWR